ncbi:MAG: glycoside hydrolase family 3 C-terminal domain-containing protein [Polyangiaceae bacterium]|nr:glycoside hydrolase family 3 C-terminal domain-containing protein [Polyangiaceae bacterium]
MRTTARSVSVFAVALALAGCSACDSRRDPPQDASAGAQGGADSGGAGADAAPAHGAGAVAASDSPADAASDSATDSADRGAADSGADAASDSAVDGGATDSGVDAADDAAADAAHSGPSDSAVDAADDAADDAAADAAHSGPSDSAVDAAEDSSLDAAGDAAGGATGDADGSVTAEFAERAADLVAAMTLEEKVSQMGNTAPAIPRLGIPAYQWWNEALHGVAWSGIATVFPQAISLAATFDPELELEVATAISTEARVKNNIESKGLTYWSPTVNLARDPRWGRNEETYGEDPYLASRMALQFVRGMQGNDSRYLKTIATVKHYAANNIEATRFTGSSDVDERNLQELYFPAFKATAQEVGSVMCAYNRVNGVPACADRWLLQETLRDRFGFQGYVVSDCDAVDVIFAGHYYAADGPEASKMALGAGTDLNCGGRFQYDLVGLVSAGELDETQIDMALRRLFLARFRLGEFDPPESVPYRSIPASALDGPEHGALALRAARESMVLLKNDGLLPLDTASLGSVAVIGPNAAALVFGGYSGDASAPVTVLDGIQTRVNSDGIAVSFVQGTTISSAIDESSIEAAAQAAAVADIAIVVAGIDLSIAAEGCDRTDIALPAIQEELIEAVVAANAKTVLVLVAGAPLAVTWAEENVPAILLAGYGGQAAGTAVAEVLFGDTNPAGRLPQTYYRSLGDLPPMEDYDIIAGKRGYMYFDGEVLYPFGHGLSYTEFAYGNLKLKPTTLSEAEELTISFEVTNTGSRAGDEVAQVYVHDAEASVPVPIKQLKRFQRLRLESGETQTVTLTVPATELAFYDVDAKGWTVEPGEFEIMVGASSADIRVGGTITVRP